jgi:hypothetical protein
MGLVREIAPETIDDVSITLTENRIPVVRFCATRSDIAQWHEEKLTAGELLFLSRLDTGIYETPDIQRRDTRLVRWGFRPIIESFLNDPSGFFKARAGLEVWSSLHPWKGASLYGRGSYPNNISTTNEPLSNPVSVRLVGYKEQDVSLGRLMFDQIVKTPGEVHGRVSGGFLEIQYAGLDGEVAVPVLDGRLMTGISGSVVKKRDPDNPLKLAQEHYDEVKDHYRTPSGSTRRTSGADAFFDVKAGPFLAGDLGARFSVSKFINGVVVTAWYGVTSTSKFTDEYNRDYEDSGLQVTIPLRLFKGADSRTSYWYSISPWTRDVAQDISHYNNLFDFMGRNTKLGFERDVVEMER